MNHDNLNHVALVVPVTLKFAWVILALPLLSFIVNGLWTCRKKQALSIAISMGLSTLSLAWAVVIALQWWLLSSDHSEGILNHTIVPFDWVWLPMGGVLTAHIGMLLDPISVMMIVVICSIAFLVHIYSIGYMHEDPSRGRFFPLLSHIMSAHDL